MPRRWSSALARTCRAFVFVFLASATAAAAQTGRVQGTVRDEGGKPIRGATVVARNPDAMPASFETTTDERGRFSILGLQAGRWTFTASAPGHSSGTGGGRVSSVGTNPHFEFRLQRSSPLPPLLRPAAGHASPGVPADVMAADVLLSAGRLDEALSAYDAMLRRHPGRTEVILRLGQVYRLKREFDRALEVLASIPDDVQVATGAAHEMGLALFERGDLRAAEQVLTRAAATADASRDVLFTMGEVKLAQALPEDATSWFERAAAADPGWARPLLKLGLIAANGGDRDTAAKYLRQVLRLAPESIEARQARAVLDQFR